MFTYTIEVRKLIGYYMYCDCIVHTNTNMTTCSIYHNATGSEVSYKMKIICTIFNTCIIDVSFYLCGITSENSYIIIHKLFTL